MIIGVIQMTRSRVKDILIILFILLVCSSCGKRGELIRPEFSVINIADIVN